MGQLFVDYIPNHALNLCAYHQYDWNCFSEPFVYSQGKIADEQTSANRVANVAVAEESFQLPLYVDKILTK